MAENTPFGWTSRPWVRGVAILLAVVGLGVLVVFIKHILMPFLIGLGLAYLLDPVVTRLEKRGVPRAVGIVIIVLVVLVGLVLLGFYIVPRAQSAVTQLSSGVPSQVEGLKSRLSPKLRELDEKYHEQIVAATEKARAALEENLPKLLSPVQRALKRAFSSFVGFFVSLVSVISVPVFTFYLLKDIEKVRQMCIDVMPPRYRGQILERVREIDEVVSAFVRGQLLVATILSIIYMIGLGIIGVPGAVLVGIFCGYANLVPYLGIATGIPLASVLAYVGNQDFGSAVWVWVLFAAAQFLEGTVISPYIVGEKVGLHPVVMILALMVWGEFFGFIGLLLAVPATAALVVLLKAWYRNYRNSDFYNREAIHLSG